MWINSLCVSQPNHVVTEDGVVVGDGVSVGDDDVMVVAGVSAAAAVVVGGVGGKTSFLGH